MKPIGVVATSKHDFNQVLEELGVRNTEEIIKFHFIGRIDDIFGMEFFTVIRAYPYSQDWKMNALFEQAKERIR